MRRAGGVAVVALAAILVARRASCDPPPLESPPLVPTSPSAYGSVFTTFQANTPLIRPNGDRQHRYPFYQYMDLSVASPEQHLSINTFLRARAIGNGDEASFDVYNAQIDYRRPDQVVQEIRLGRQILTEGANYTLMDGALARVHAADGVEVVGYAGRTEVDLQPKPDHPSDSYTVFGAKLRTSRLLGSLMTLGYEGTAADAFTARHFLTASFDRVVPYTDFANVYSRLEFDVLQTNPAYFTAGVGISAAKPLYLNLEYDTYKPDKDRDEFLQDMIFDVFSVSRLQEARIGGEYHANSFLKISASYSYATYDSNHGVSSHGNIAKLGFNWDLWRRLGLHAFNGVYAIEGRGRDQAIGMNAGVSEEILRGLEVHLEIAYANFHSLTHKNGNAYSYIGGVQYMLVRNLMVRGEVELNTNPDFRHDVRGNFGLSYSFT